VVVVFQVISSVAGNCEPTTCQLSIDALEQALSGGIGYSDHVGAGGSQDRLADAVHQRSQPLGLGRHLLLQGGALHQQGPVRHGALDNGVDLLEGLERLEQIIPGMPVAQSGDGRFDAAGGGDHHAFHPGVDRARGLQQVQPVYPRHHQVGQQDSKPLARFQELESAQTVGGGYHRIAVAFERARQQEKNVFVVIYNQDTVAVNLHTTASAIAICRMGKRIVNVVPWPTMLFTSILPLWLLIIP